MRGKRLYLKLREGERASVTFCKFTWTCGHHVFVCLILFCLKCTEICAMSANVKHACV